MYLKHLGLRNFRTYKELELDFPPGLCVLYGENGRGKSNLMEAIYLLALTKSHRAESDREVIRFESLKEVPYTRIVGTANHFDGSEVTVQVDMGLPVPVVNSGSLGSLAKRIRVNGVPRLASAAIGAVNAVLFSAEDIFLVTGPPAGRRRFLDVLTSQMEQGYMRTLQTYQRILTQRNQLLRRVGDGTANTQELEFWDREFSLHGARLIQGRQMAVTSLAPLAAAEFARLSSDEERLELHYEPAVEPNAPIDEIETRLLELLSTLRHKEIQVGQTLIGPHRDDLRLFLDTRQVGSYGSRGQARLVALVLRLAEADLLAQRLRDEPILLLDDVFSELDARRRDHVLERAHKSQQALVTMVGLEQHPRASETAIAIAEVRKGTVSFLQ
jgi:DNA replication and repair protein RecF